MHSLFSKSCHWPPCPWRSGLFKALSAALLAGMLTACVSPPNKAPVEDRNAAKLAGKAESTPTLSSEPVAGSGVPVDAVKLLPGAENAGKPGYYTVKPGDTLIRVGLENGQNWRDVLRWNALENPNLIEVGQVLRVVPPGLDAGAVASRGVTVPRVDARPLDSRPAPAAGMSATASSPATGALPAPAAGRDGDEDLNWSWPASGAVLAGFEEGKQKGLTINGKAGDPVLAAADGRVVYAGSGLRGYGNLVIVKHNNIYLTAYAHNQTLLVKEDQAVRRGQKIAEMGSSDATRVQLHFEIRRQGKPIDPARLLPTR
jgi:lipoprotein NlpD